MPSSAPLPAPPPSSSFSFLGRCVGSLFEAGQKARRAPNSHYGSWEHAGGVHDVERPSRAASMGSSRRGARTCEKGAGEAARGSRGVVGGSSGFKRAAGQGGFPFFEHRDANSEACVAPKKSVQTVRAAAKTNRRVARRGVEALEPLVGNCAQTVRNCAGLSPVNPGPRGRKWSSRSPLSDTICRQNVLYLPPWGRPEGLVI